MYPTVEARKTKPYTQFRKNLRRITLDDDTNPHYELEGAEPYSELYNVSHPKRPDPKQLYKQYIFEPVYKFFKDQTIEVDEDGN